MSVLTLKKREVIKHLPNLASFRKDAKAKMAQGNKLIGEAEKAAAIVDALNGVQLYNGEFPVRVNELNGGIEVASGCAEVKRSAYVKPAPESNKFVVVTYRNEGGDTEGTPVDGEYTRINAMNIAKDFVATGKKSKPVNVSPKPKRLQA